MLLNVELTAPLTNETRHLFWIWCHCYTQACIPGEWAASVKRRPASPCTALRWQYWFNLLIRSLGLTERKTQPKLLNYSSHAALLTLYSSTDGNSSRYWHLWIKILKKMSGVSSHYLDQTEQNAVCWQLHQLHEQIFLLSYKFILIPNVIGRFKPR